MKESTKLLLAEFVDMGLRPAKLFTAIDGKTRLVWHVDDDDDRYVELVDSSRGAGCLVLMRNRDFVISEMMYWPEVIYQVGRLLQQLHASGAGDGKKGEGS